MNNNLKNNKQGIAALLSVVVIATIALVLSKASFVLGQTDLAMSNDNIHASQALANAESCASEAIRRVQIDENYSGEIDISLNNGNCRAISTKGESEYSIVSVGNILNYQKELRLVFKLNEQGVEIISYQTE